MNRKLAEETSILALQLGAKLDRHLALLKEECNEEEFVSFQKATGVIMAELLAHFMNPIYEGYPELKPEQLGGTYKVNESIYE